VGVGYWVLGIWCWVLGSSLALAGGESVPTEKVLKSRNTV